MSKRNSVFVVLLLAVAAALVWRANHEASPDSEVETTDVPAPVEQGTQSFDESRRGGQLTMALQADILTLDPHLASDAASIHVLENLYSGLMRYGETYGEVENDLALGYTISDDQLTYTFELREGVYFHSGNPLTASDVVFSLQRIKDKGVRGSNFALVEAIEALDEQTVVLRLKRPFAPLVTYLAHPMNAVVDAKVVKANPEIFKDGAVGCGPFKLGSWQRGQRLAAVRHDRYHETGLPYLEKVAFRFISDEGARLSALRSGAVDVVLDVPAKAVEALSSDERLVLQSKTGTFWEYIGFNVKEPPFNDVLARRAVAQAVDRQVLNRLVKLGQAEPRRFSPLPKSHWAFIAGEGELSGDADVSKELLASAELEHGFKVTLTVGSDFEYQVAAAQVVKQQLRPLGIEVDIESLESGLFFDKLNRRDFQMTLVGWVGFVDPDEWFFDIFHSSGKWNQQSYANLELDRLLEVGRSTLDKEQRKEIYGKVQSILADDLPLTVLYLNSLHTALRPSVKGYETHVTSSTRGLLTAWMAL